MTDHRRFVLAQCNFCVGDIDGNTSKVIDGIRAARDDLGADVVIFPELAVTGYPPEDLLFRPGLHRRVDVAMTAIADAARDIHVIVGYPERDGAQLYNSCAVFRAQRRIASYRKRELPNYAVFDEKRYFVAGDGPCVVEIGGIRVGLSICEDVWTPRTAAETSAAGAELICNINASPYHFAKYAERLRALGQAVAAGHLPILYVNAVGGQDELIFDGGSLAVDAQANVVARARDFEEQYLTIDVSRSDAGLLVTGPMAMQLQDEAAIYGALVLGIKDYVRKNRFNGCVLGLSGGIDSALTLALAVDALGAENVVAVSMPSKYTAGMSVDDARTQTQTLDCEFHIVSIENPVTAFDAALGEIIDTAAAGVTGENVQARCRGLILMAISNETGSMVLATGNKSEMAVGYATLYGDMVGGFAPLKDIPKTLVYRLARWRNSSAAVIPERVIERPPSAELAPDQKDSDSLPPYEVLDPILEHYIEADMTPREIAALGYDIETVKRVAALVDRNEYKRRQAAPGVRITRRAFGRDRRFPITSRYSEQRPVTR